MLVSHQNKPSFFSRYPETTATVNGTKVPTPFHGYDVDATVLYGKSNLKALEKYLAPTGLKPYDVGGGKGLAQLWLNDYKDTNLDQPYQEAVLIIPATKDGKKLEWKNDFTATAPSFQKDTKLVAVRLLLPKNDPTAIAYGRELLGLDKRAAEKMKFEHKRGSDSFEVAEGGKPAFDIEVKKPKGGLLSQLKPAVEVLGNVGPKKLVENFTRGTLDVEAQGTLPGFKGREIPGHVKSKPQLQRIDPKSFHAGSSEFGQLLKELDFAPTAATHDPHMKFVLELPRTG